VAWRRLDIALPVGFTALVTATTAAARAGAFPVDAVAASPHRLEDGAVWRLVADGAVAQQPVVLSLVAFAILSVAAVRVCGRRGYLAAALGGHVGSTLVAYAVVAAALAAHVATRRTLDVDDYGVSAVEFAWIGAIAAAAWRHPGQTATGRGLIVLSCAAIAAIGYALHPELTLLDVDHPFALAIGAAVAGRLPAR
jgi:hypothetical protein